MKKIFFLIFLACLFSATSLMGLESGQVDIHGFLAQGFLKTDKNNFYGDTIDGSFQFSEMGINFTTRLSPRLRAGIQLFARDIGPYGNDEITLDWVYGDFRYQRWLGLRFGLIKIPLSLYSETRDMDHLRTWIFLPQGVYHEIRRDTFASRKGMEVYGALPRNFIGTFSYRAQMGVLGMEPGDGNSTFLEALVYPVWTVDDIKPETSYLGRIDWSTPLDGFEAGFYYSEYDGDYKNEERERKETGAGVSETRSKYFSKEYCLSTRFDITPSWIFKLEAHMFDGVSVLIDQDQVDLEEDETTLDDWWLFAVKTSFTF